MEDISIRKLSLVRMLEVAIIVIPMFVYIHHGQDAANKRADQINNRIDATNSRIDATIADGNRQWVETNKRMDATWERLTAAIDRQQQSNGGK